jgi:hypothetical protein
MKDGAGMSVSLANETKEKFKDFSRKKVKTVLYIFAS